MNGALVIDKPAGITSHDVISRVRRILGTRRVGHTGTLDPFATGVVVVLIGQATRLAQFLDKDEKEYLATIRFGYETDTGDLTGAKLEPASDDPAIDRERLVDADWDSVFDSFRGETEQIPPMYSAKKVDGQKLYELARKGKTIERKPVKVTIHKLENVDSSHLDDDDPTLTIRIICSAGTFIRTLAEDIGRKIGVGAHLTELRRVRAGRFSLSDSITLDGLQQLDDPFSAILPMESAVSHLSVFKVAGDRIQKTRNGLSSRVSDLSLKSGEAVRMTDDKGALIAIGIFDAAENSIQPKVVLV